MNICIVIGKEGIVYIAREYTTKFRAAICPFKAASVTDECTIDCPYFDLNIEDEKNMVVCFRCANAYYKVDYFRNKLIEEKSE